jgi:hypothetical protein
MDALKLTHPRTLLVALLVVAVTLVLSFYTNGRHVAYTTDSLIYHDLASNMLAGHFGYMTNLESDDPPILPMTRWPPLYPAAWSIAAKLSGQELDGVIHAMSVALQVITTLTLFWAGVAITGSAPCAALITMMYGILPSSQSLFAYAWSETLFLPMVIVAMALTLRHANEPRLGFLLGAAVLVGLANLTRYVGVVFIPMLAFSVLVFSNRSWVLRFRDAAIATAVSTLVVLPLWLRNWSLSGHIAGSGRGGRGDPARLLQDSAQLFEFFGDSIFAFDKMYKAVLQVPLVIVLCIAVLLAANRNGFGLLREKRMLLPAAWGAGYLAFLLLTRLLAKEVDFDLRMNAVAAPFILLALGLPVLATFKSPNVVGLRVLIGVVGALVIYSGLSVARDVHAQRARDEDARWPSTSAQHFRDMSRSSELSAWVVSALAQTPRDDLVLTTYRPLYLRYLGWKRSHAISSDEECVAGVTRADHGTILVDNPYSKERARLCVASAPGWRVVALWHAADGPL